MKVCCILLAMRGTLSAGVTQVLTVHVPPGVKRLNLQPMGRLPAVTPLDLHIGLPLRHQAEFDHTLAQFYDPASPQYHRWLTPEQIAERFGPSEQDYQSVIAFAESNGPNLINLPVQASGGVWVDCNYKCPTFRGTFNQPYPRLGKGASVVPSGGYVVVKPGSSEETMEISKPMRIQTISGTATIGR